MGYEDEAIMALQRIISQTSLDENIDEYPDWNQSDENRHFQKEGSKMGNEWDNLRDEYRRTRQEYLNRNLGYALMDGSYGQSSQYGLDDENLSFSGLSDENSLNYLASNQNEEI